jgi:hypothetical protein
MRVPRFGDAGYVGVSLDDVEGASIEPDLRLEAVDEALPSGDFHGRQGLSELNEEIDVFDLGATKSFLEPIESELLEDWREVGDDGFQRSRQRADPLVHESEIGPDRLAQTVEDGDVFLHRHAGVGPVGPGPQLEGIEPLLDVTQGLLDERLLTVVVPFVLDAGAGVNAYVGLRFAVDGEQLVHRFTFRLADDIPTGCIDAGPGSPVVATVVAAVGEELDVKGVLADEEGLDRLLGVLLDVIGPFVRAALADTDNALIGEDLGNGSIRLPDLVIGTVPQVLVWIDVGEWDDPDIADGQVLALDSVQWVVSHRVLTQGIEGVADGEQPRAGRIKLPSEGSSTTTKRSFVIVGGLPRVFN